jgi:hypothetical protein
MPDNNSAHANEVIAVEGFLNEIQELIKDLRVVVEMNRLCKNEHGRLTAFGDFTIAEGISRKTPVGVLTRMTGITKQAVWERRSHIDNDDGIEETVESMKLGDSLYSVRATSLLKHASSLSRSMLRLRLLFKSPKGNRLSEFGKEFLVIALRHDVEPGLIASVLDVSSSYISLFRQRRKNVNCE